MSRLKIGLFNDSFPPTIDGVAQAVKNYAAVLHDKHCDVTVVTPDYKDVQDDTPSRCSGTVRCAPTSGSATGWAILLTPKP